MSIWDLTEEDRANMRRAGWSDQAIELFEAKESVGELEDASVCHMARTEAGEAARFCIRVEEGRIAAARHSYQGCPALAATCAAITRLSQGKTIDEAGSLTVADVWGALGGLPGGHDREVSFPLGAFIETLNIFREQKRLIKAQHDSYTHICGLTGRQLEESKADPCDECPWLQNCENDHTII